MDENDTIHKEIIFYLSECLDLSIKASYCYGDTSQADSTLDVLYDLLDTLHLLETKLHHQDTKMSPDTSTQ